MVDVRGDVLRPPHCTTPATVKANNNNKKKMDGEIPPPSMTFNTSNVIAKNDKSDTILVCRSLILLKEVFDK